jgi:putative tricarboxylic transport membrane protein
MQPGPLMLLRNQVEIYSLIWALTAACIIASFIGLLLARPLAGLTRVNVHILAPIIIAIGYAGSYAIDLEIENILLTTLFAIIGYLLIRFRYPRIPVVIALVLGAIAERGYRQSMMMSNENPLIFLQRPICVLLILAIAASLILPNIGRARRARGAGAPGKQGGASNAPEAG